jgi:hypothetical protein
MLCDWNASLFLFHDQQFICPGLKHSQKTIHNTSNIAEQLLHKTDLVTRISSESCTAVSVKFSLKYQTISLLLRGSLYLIFFQ